MKVSILMPTYNDCDSICHTFDSIINQTHTNWELIIIDDGSTDNTTKVVESYIKKNKLEGKFKYIKQENTDQLLALINGSKYITGDYVYILHSDDLFASDTALENACDYVEKHPDIDGILPNILIIDDKDNITAKQKLLPYKKSDKNLAIDLLWLGRNMYSDFPFIKKEIFTTKMKENYLTWNRPFWLNISETGASMLNMHNVPFCMLKYRVYEGNYANNEVGLMCLMNGELRCATSLMKFYNIPCYKLQYFIYRCIVHLHLFKIYRPIYFKKETKNTGEVVKYIIKKRYPNGFNNIFYESLIKFYENKNDRTINYKDIYVKDDPIYEGNKLRLFNKQIVGHSLPKTYINFMKEMSLGFNKIVVSKKDKEDAIKILKFLCIYYFVEVEVK